MMYSLSELPEIKHWKRRTKQRNRYYPSGTVLCNHKCVQPKPVLGMTSEAETVCSVRETDLPSTLSFWLSSTIGKELSLCTPLLRLSPLTLAVKSAKPMNGLIGVDGAEFRDTTDGGDIDDAGARTVKLRSSDVKFKTWRVKTWNMIEVALVRKEG